MFTSWLMSTKRLSYLRDCGGLFLDLRGFRRGLS